MSADAEILNKALVYANSLIEFEKRVTRMQAAERAARQYDLGPLDEEWLIEQIARPPAPPPN